jgi:hypothetical protein
MAALFNNSRLLETFRKPGKLAVGRPAGRWIWLLEMFRQPAGPAFWRLSSSGQRLCAVRYNRLLLARDRPYRGRPGA